MAACGKRFELERQPRVCELEEGHEGGCAGAAAPGLFRLARQRAKERHRLREEAHRREVEILAAQERRGAIAAGFSPAEFAALILQACQGEGCPLGELPERLGLPLMVNRLPAGPRELRQMVARLKRDRQLEELGGYLISIATP